MVTADDIDDLDFDLPAEPLQSSSRGVQPPSSSEDRRKWTVMYPIYIDAKASLKHRRVSKQLAVPWPQAKLMAIQCNRLGLRAHIEGGASHPADWNNPGRVRVQLDINGTFAHPTIRTKQALIDAVAKGHPHVSDSAPIYERLAVNSPMFARGILDEAISNPQGMMPPGMEGFGAPQVGAGGSNSGSSTPPSTGKGKETAQGFPGGKQKKKVVHVRR